MRNSIKESLLFLAWEKPWPVRGGNSLRTMGIMRELSKRYNIHLLVLSQRPLTSEQESVLGNYASPITRVPMAGITSTDQLRILVRMFSHQIPYHSALLDLSLRRRPKVLKQVQSFPEVVYANLGHWGVAIREGQAPNWILDQQNADVDFWRVYANQAPTLWLRLAALVNWQLAAAYFPRIYSNVGCIVSVCEADRQLTLALADGARVEVIENGVDCSYYVPERTTQSGELRLLFTGTSAPRNVTALRQFLDNVWPLVRRKLPDTELLVAGNFKPEAQVEFEKYSHIRFTGKVDDMRPHFNQSHIFISPFEETHGSKLKIAEAMAMGIPIVSTPQGIRGFQLVDGRSVLLAETNKQFAEQIINLAKDECWQERLGAAARQVALATIDWRILGNRLRKIVATTADNLS